MSMPALQITSSLVICLLREMPNMLKYERNKQLKYARFTYSEYSTIPKETATFFYLTTDFHIDKRK